MRSVGVSAPTRARSASSCACLLRFSRSRAIGLLDRAEQHVGGDRLGQEILCARLHGQDAGRNVAMSGKKHDRQRVPHFGQSLLELQPAEPRHAQVEQNATRGFDIGRFQELCRRFVLPDPISDRPQQSRGRLAPGRIVVDHMHDAGGGRHERCAEANGSVKRNTAPPPGAFSARISPPCASMIVRDIASPRPMPVDLDVTKGSKMRGRSSWSDAATGIGHGYLGELVVRAPAPDRQHPSVPSACSALPRSR